MAIAIYQAVIFGIIVISSFGGRKILVRTTIALSLFTLTHVFMPWLVGVQFVTIAIAYGVGSSIAPAKSNA